MSQDMSADDDDLSDVSMPEESDSSDSDSELSSTESKKQPSNPAYMQHVVKSTGQDTAMTGGEQPLDNDGHAQQNKGQPGSNGALNSLRTRTGRMLGSGFDSLPPEVWQHIFTLTTPKTLGSLLRVNKAFNALVDPHSRYPTPVALPRRCAVPKRQPEDIWQLSRKRFLPKMPAPLDGMTELSMWRLAGNMRCASCGKRPSPSVPAPSLDQWRCGPGENGVRPIWAFGITACGSCLRNQTTKEINLLLDRSFAKSLICALAFILLTSDFHVVASTALHQGQQPPSSVQISKYFLKADIENIKQEHSRVQGLGSAAAEEWIKGLDSRGKAKRLDIARWEKWEASGGLRHMQKDGVDEPSQAVQQTLPARINTHLPSSLPPRPATFHGYSGFGRPPLTGNAYPPPPGVVSHLAPHMINAAPGLPQRVDSPAQNGYGAYGPPQSIAPKAPRTKEEAEKLKLARRLEIERRCSELNPPISPNVLVHMPSFQASLHIIKPLDDTAWDMLKPRLLSQRADAEQREKERLASTRVFQQQQTARLSHEDHPVDPTDPVEREWEATQVIVRNRIGTYSDEIIRDGWASGSKVNKETTPRFAAEVLMYVRKRFYAEIAKDDAAARAAGHPPLLDPPNGPFTRKLTLENMRWVFETKIKPHTEQYRKELFLCNGCDNLKWYAFEGVCQHYASKHTTSLSSGSVVVHWRAEWPEEPPFSPEPHLAKSTSSHSASVAPELFPNGVPAPAPTYGVSPFQGVSTAPPVASLPAAPIYHHSIPQPPQQHQFQDPYIPPQTLSYGTPAPYQPYPANPQVPHYQGPPGTVYAPFYQQPPPESHQNPSLPVTHTAPPPSQTYVGPAFVEPAGAIQHNTSLPASDPQSHIPPPIYRTEAYKTQLQDMALTAKSLWNETTGVKEMPGSVRVYLILFHVLQRLRERYTEDPSLSMLVDGIQNVKEMRVVRNVNGIACKTCTRENANKPVNPHTVSTKSSSGAERKLYSLPQLVNHFQSVHGDNVAQGSPAVDWKTDMVELPEKKKIKSLEGAAGMDEHKLQLLRDALPDAFKPDTPVMENKYLAPSQDKHDSYYNISSNRSLSPQGYEQDSGRYFDSSRGSHPQPHGGHRRGNDSQSYPSGNSSNQMKRKATSPLGSGRRPVPTDDDRYYVQMDEQGRFDQYQPYDPPVQQYLRPEYNHQDSDLSRLLANAERAAQSRQLPVRAADPVYPTDVGHMEDVPSRTSSRHMINRPVVMNQARTAAEEFLDTMTPGGPSMHAFPPSGRAESGRNNGANNQRRQHEIGEDGRPVYVTESEYDAPTPRPVRVPEYPEDVGRPSRVEYVNAPVDIQQVAEQIKYRSQQSPYVREVQPIVTPEQEHARQRTAGVVRYIDEDVRYAKDPQVQQRAPSRGSRLVEPDVIRYEEEGRTSASPVYVVGEPARRRQYRAVSPGGQHYVDEQMYESRPLPRRVEPAYEHTPPPRARQDYYEYADEQARPRPVQYAPEMEYVRVRDPAGDYLIERPKRREPIYTRYEDAQPAREPMYENARMRPVYEDEHTSMPVYQGAPRPRQVVYADDPGPRAVRYEDDQVENARYEERPRPVVTRVDDDGMPAPTAYEERPRPRQQIVYEDEAVRWQPAHERAPLSKSDPAYYEEYDPRNPAPLPEAPRRVKQYE